MVMSKRRRPLLLLPLFAGCYTYTPIEATAVRPGVEVRARITGAASDRVAPMLGTFDTRELTGNVIENNAGALILEVPTGAVPNTGASIIQLHQRVPLASTDLVTLETRQVSVARTSLLAGAIAAGVAAAAVAAYHAGGKAEGGVDESGPPPVTRIPIFRLHF